MKVINCSYLVLSTHNFYMEKTQQKNTGHMVKYSAHWLQEEALAGDPPLIVDCLEWQHEGY